MGNQFDVVEKMEKFWSSDSFTPIDIELVDQACVKISEEKPELSQKQLDFVRGELIRHHYMKFYMEDSATADEKTKEWTKDFDEKCWGIMQQKLRALPGNYKYYLEYAAHSRAIVMFDYDAWTEDFAKACLLAHGITHGFDDVMRVIDFDDIMMPSIKHNSSLAFMRYRNEQAQPDAKKAQKLGLFGGGADPLLYTHGFPLGMLGQQIVIYDKNDMRPILKQLIGCSFEQAHIDYRVDSFISAFADESQYGTYDMIIYDGVMSYYPEKKVDILKGTARLLKPGGKVFFDDQIMHPDLLFGLKVRGWTVELKPEKDLATAKQKNEEMIPAAGLIYEKQMNQTVRGIPNVLVNWAVKPLGGET